MEGNDHLVVRIAEEIATREGIELEELQPPLHEIIDVDALAQLFRSAGHERTATTGTVSFTYRDYTVTVDHTRDVRVTPVSNEVSADVVHG